MLGYAAMLALMPWGIGDVLGYLPFASMASAPLRIYTGTGDPALLLGLQAFWLAVRYLVTAGLARRLNVLNISRRIGRGQLDHTLVLMVRGLRSRCGWGC